MIVTDLTDINHILLKFTTINSIKNLFLLDKTISNLIENSGYFKGLSNINRIYEGGYLNIVKLFFNDKNFDIIFDNKCPLVLAASHGHLEIIQFINKYGVHTQSHPDCIKNAFKKASRYGYLEIVKFIHLNCACSCEYKDLALIKASKNGHLEIVRYLCENGANIHTDEDRVVIDASQNGHLEIVKYLHNNGANIHTEEDYALIEASENGHLEVVKYLCENDAKISAQDYLALVLAVENEHLTILQYFIDCNVDIEIFSELLFQTAISYGHIHIVEYLCENSSLIQGNQNNFIKYASAYGRLETIKYLLEKGADINSALITAIKNKRIDIIKYICDLDVDIRVDNDSAINYALRNGYSDIAQLLYDKGNYTQSLDKK